MMGVLGPVAHLAVQLHVVARLGKAGVSGAVSAAEESAAAFDAVPYDLAPAVLANRRQLVNSTFKAVKHVPLSGRDDLEAQGVVVTANLTFRHVCETRLRTLAVFGNRYVAALTA
jgi:hypothetical protein